MAWNSAGSSPGTTMVSAHRPCLRPFRRTAARPSGVFGPVECCAFWRFASIFKSDVMAHLWLCDWFEVGNTFRFYGSRGDRGIELSKGVKSPGLWIKLRVYSLLG